MFGNNYVQPYFTYNAMQRQQPQTQPQIEQYGSPFPQQYMKPQGLQGKVVESLEVVKAIDIPLDGSTSYFVIADGTAIVTKQLQSDGTSKIVVYKPTENEPQTKTQYVTIEEFEKFTNEYQPNGLKELKEEIKNFKRQLRDINEELKEKKGE